MYESLMKEAEQRRLYIYEMPLSERIKGLQMDNVIWINKNMTTAEKVCTLAEEIIHTQTTVGDILDQSKMENRKQEIFARRRSYECLVPFSKIVQAFESGVLDIHEMAEFLNITEKFLCNALEYYKTKYGFAVEYRQYTIYFDPLNVVSNA